MRHIGVGLVVVVLAVIFSSHKLPVRGTTDGKGVLYPFPIDTTLTCYQEIKLLNGRTRIVAETPPRLPVLQRVSQGDNPRVFIPQDTTFRQPSLQGFNADVEAKLLAFLGNDYNPMLTSPTLPVRDPPRACEVLPAFEGSAGQQKIHTELIQEPVPILDEFNPLGEENSQTFISLLNLPADPLEGRPEIRNDNTTRENRFPSMLSDFRGFTFDYLRYLNPHDEFCELWIAKCPLTPVWAELPQTFFPRYFAQGTCTGKNCSYPRGLTCEEDFTYTVYVTVLRWDCCYSAELSQLRWDCGWRKVQIPILCDCTCACGPIFGSSMTG